MFRYFPVCSWEEVSLDRDLQIFQGGELIVLCLHQQGRGFCDYWELSADERATFCPHFSALTNTGHEPA
jgi:hypothetical protein